MTFYEEMQGIATGLLTEFKQGVIQIAKITPGSGPKNNPGPSTETLTTLKGAVARGVKFKYVQSGMAVASDLQVTHAVQDGVTPAIDGFVYIDGVKYKIVNIVDKPAAGTKVVHTLIVRKG